MKRLPFIFALIVWMLFPLASSTTADDEFQEAIQQTEDEWKAVRTTMQEGKGKFDDFRKKYNEYHDAVFSDSPEQGIELAKKLFNLDQSQTAAANDKLNQLREMFNELDKAGLKEKLESASKYLDKADKYAGKAQNLWEFTKKFDPEHAKDNPTYGLRLIGKMLTESASKMEKIPLVGQILGKWIKAYGEVAVEFANALDKLAKKIDDFRGGSLCGQLGYRQDQQTAFKAAGGTNCMVYFASGIFPRMRGETYEGNNDYFLYDPATKRGYVASKEAETVYKWHELLLERRALDPDWLASRANSLKAEIVSEARRFYTLFSGWKNKTDLGWVIIDKLGLYDDAYFYGRLDEETFIANYILTDKHQAAVNAVIKEYEKYVLVSGTVYEEEDDHTRRSGGAKVEFTVGGTSYSETTEDNGQYEIMMAGKANDAIHEKVSKSGFDTIERDGRLPQKVTSGLDYTLTKGAFSAVILGTVTIKRDTSQAATPCDGASVLASAPHAAGLGSATTAGDGSYTLSVQIAKGVDVTCTATRDGFAGSATVKITGESHSGVDIIIDATADTTGDTSGTGVAWIINATVLDDNGQPLANAVVSCTYNVAAATTGADGVAVIGPIDVPANWEAEPFSVTLTPSVVAQGGIKVGGSAMTVVYEGATPSAVTLTIPVIIPMAVTITGTVTDVNGIGVSGAVVTGGGQALTVSATGTFTLGPFMLIKDSSITLMATLTHGANTFGGAPQTVTFDGANATISGVVITLDMESEIEVTISGLVHDMNGKPLAGATVTIAAGGSATTDGAGHYTLPPITHILGTPVAISASVTISSGATVAGQGSCTPMADVATAPTIVIQVEQDEVHDVTISGSVLDEQGAGVSGAVVISGSVSTTTDASGVFALPPIQLIANESAAVSATHTAGSTQLSGGPVTVTFDGTITDIGGVVITLSANTTPVTVTGTVNSSDGNPISGASVSSGGATATTDAGGSFSLGPIDHELGTPLSLSANVVLPDGGSAGGNTTVTPTTGSVSASIAIDMSVSSDDDSEIDDDIDDIEDDGKDVVDYDALLAEFAMAVAELDGVAADFDGLADFFDQRLRELREEACSSADVSYALTNSTSQVEMYALYLTGLYGLYGEIIAAQASDPENRSLGNVESEFTRCVDREGSLEARRESMSADYSTWQCDEDQAETDEGDRADDDADPDDVESGADEGGGVEICGDGIDNDGDNEIDECDAGCCDKNVQIIVSDCGELADDIFLIAVDGGDIGVTPKGAANTFNVELSPGDHSITVTCLDDGGEPLGTDIGTACVTVVVFGESQAIGGGEMGIAYGGSQTISFYVSEGPVSAKIHRTFNGASLRGLEQ